MDSSCCGTDSSSSAMEEKKISISSMDQWKDGEKHSKERESVRERTSRQTAGMKDSNEEVELPRIEILSRSLVPLRFLNLCTL